MLIFNFLFLLVFTLFLLILFYFLPTNFFYLLILSIFTTEFFKIEIWGGLFRVSYFGAVLIFLGFLIFSFKKVLRSILRSSIIIFLYLFLFYNLIITLIIPEGYKLQSLFSFGLLVIMTIFAQDIYLFLIYTRKDVGLLKSIAYAAFIASIFGIIQLLATVLFHKPIIFNPAQKSVLLSDLRISSFYHEADTFGKSIMIVVLLLLPLSLKENMYRKGYQLDMRKNWKPSRHLILILIMTLVFTMTRSAIAGFLGGIGILLFLKFKRLLKFIQNLVPSLIFSVIIIISLNRFSIFSQRLFSLFDIKTTIKNDPSAKLRTESILKSLKDFTNAEFVYILFGSGWANLRTEVGSRRLEGTSNMFVTIFIYSGFLGLLGYIFLIWKTSRVLYLTYKQKNSLMALGGFTALIGGIIASMMAPMITAPEFWLLFGLAAYFDTYNS